MPSLDDMVGHDPTVKELVHDLLTIYNIRFDDATSRAVAIETWTKQFLEAKHG